MPHDYAMLAFGLAGLLEGWLEFANLHPLKYATLMEITTSVLRAIAGGILLAIALGILIFGYQGDVLNYILIALASFLVGGSVYEAKNRSNTL